MLLLFKTHIRSDFGSKRFISTSRISLMRKLTLNLQLSFPIINKEWWSIFCMFDPLMCGSWRAARPILYLFMLFTKLIIAPSSCWSHTFHVYILMQLYRSGRFSSFALFNFFLSLRCYHFLCPTHSNPSSLPPL